MSDESQAEYIFEIKDWRNRTVRLTRQTFEIHKKRHPEFVPYLEAAKLTIKDPDSVAKADNNGIFLIRYGLGDKHYKNLYLCVVVFYNNDEGIEATHHFQRQYGDLTIIERRYMWIAGNRLPIGGLK